MNNSITCHYYKGFHWAIITLSLFLGSCAQKVDRLFHDPSFTHRFITTSTFAIGGFVSNVENLPPRASKEYATVMGEALLSALPELSVFPASQTEAKIGAKLFESAMDQFRLTGVIERSTLKEIKSALKNVRYVVYASLDDDYISKDKSTRYMYDDQHPFDRDRYRRRATEVEVTYSTSRTAVVTMAIYDLEREKPVWSGALTERLRNIYRRRYLWRGGLLLNRFPEAPTTRETLASVFEMFAHNFPKPEKIKK